MRRGNHRWWHLANDRRQRLIVKKHKGGGLTKDQEEELVMLQKVAEAVIDYGSPYTPAPVLPRLDESEIKRETK